MVTAGTFLEFNRCCKVSFIKVEVLLRRIHKISAELLFYRALDGTSNLTMSQKSLRSIM